MIIFFVREFIVDQLLYLELQKTGAHIRRLLKLYTDGVKANIMACKRRLIGL